MAVAERRGGITPFRVVKRGVRRHGLLHNGAQVQDVVRQAGRIPQVGMHPHPVRTLASAQAKEAPREPMVWSGQAAGQNPGCRVACVNRRNNRTGQRRVIVRVRRGLPEAGDVWLVPDFEDGAMPGEMLGGSVGVVRKGEHLGGIRRGKAARVERVSVVEDEQGFHATGVERLHQAVEGGPVELVGLRLDARPGQIHPHPVHPGPAGGVQGTVVAREMNVHAEALPEVAAAGRRGDDRLERRVEVERDESSRATSSIAMAPTAPASRASPARIERLLMGG